ncbi:hypothetical protein BHE74_00056643, partial [Ensete ventricosum]
IIKGIFRILDKRTVPGISRIVESVFRILCIGHTLKFIKFYGARASFSQKDAIALFAHPHCATATATTPTKAVAALARRQPPYQGVTTPTVGAAAPVGDRVGHVGKP